MQDVAIVAETITATSKLVSSGAIVSGTNKGQIDANGNLTIGGIAGQGKAATQALATAGTVLLTANDTILPLTAAAAATGVIMTKGTVDGQQVTLINEGATNAITMAAAGTSFCALGTGVTMAAFAKFVLVWDNTTQLWY